MEWRGLLNWSMQYTDGTRPSEFKVMDEETKSWLKEALQSFVVDDIEILKKSCKILSEPEEFSSDQQCAKENAADLVLGIIENLDIPLNLVKLNGLQTIVKCMIGSIYPSVRKACASIFSSAVQNNPPVQQKAVEEHALEGLYAIIEQESDLELKEQYFSCLSGLVRGEFQVARERFVAIGGMELVKAALQGQSKRILKKTLLMVSDLLYNSRSKGDLRISEICEEIGIIESLRTLANNEDQEIVEMTQWAIHNHLITAQ